jgi:DNA-nicking Smr family endonuclease
MESQIESLYDLFPQIDAEVIRYIYFENGGDEEKSTNALIQVICDTASLERNSPKENHKATAVRIAPNPWMGHNLKFSMRESTVEQNTTIKDVRKGKQKASNSSSKLNYVITSEIIDEYTMDLHGLHVKEAISRVDAFLSTTQKTRERLLESGKRKKIRRVRLSIITGLGRHSPGKVPKIKPGNKIESYRR